MGVLSNIEPYGVFHFFEEICGIPHESSDTKKISDYLVKFAIDKNLRYIQDESNNVIIFKDGTAGYEDSAPVMLQGHMDMVCEKDVDCDIDFERDMRSVRTGWRKVMAGTASPATNPVWPCSGPLA